MKKWVPGVLLLVAVGCAPIRPPVPPPPLQTATVWVEVWDGRTTGVKVPGAVVVLDAFGEKPTRVTDAFGNAAFTQVLGGPRHIWVTAEAFRAFDQHIDIPKTGELHVPVTLLPLQAPGPTPRAGLVRLDNRVWVDDGGPFLGLGASLFWGVWGYEHDRARLEQTLTFLAERGVDFVRVLGAVGPRYWADRTVDPTTASWPSAIDGLTDLAYEKGLRVEWTIFGGIDRTPTSASRRTLVDRFILMSQARATKIAMWEVANEAWGTGWEGMPAEARSYGRLLLSSTPHVVAVTAEEEPCAGVYYSDGAGSLRTAHLSRAVDGEGESWRPVRQPWEMMFCSNPTPWMSNEPIGPGSSVESDADPLRLVMSAATTWLSGGAAYVFHSRPGIRGGGVEDMARGGPANWWEVANVETTLAGFKAVRALLPPDLPNWTRHNCNANFPNRPFDCDGTTHLRTYCASKGQDVVCLPLQIKGTLRLTARQAIKGQWYDALTGESLGAFDVPAGGQVLIEGREAVIMKATR